MLEDVLEHFEQLFSAGAVGWIVIAAIAFLGFISFTAAKIILVWLYRVGFESDRDYDSLKVVEIDDNSEQIIGHTSKLKKHLTTGHGVTVRIKNGLKKYRVEGIIYRGKKPKIDYNELHIPSDLMDENLLNLVKSTDGTLRVNINSSKSLWNSPVPEIKISTRVTFWVTVITTGIAILIELFTPSLIN